MSTESRDPQDLVQDWIEEGRIVEAVEISPNEFIVKIKKETPAEPAFLQAGFQDDLGPLVSETFALLNEKDAPDPLAGYSPEYLLQNALLLEQNNEWPHARTIYAALIKKGMMIPQAHAGTARAYEQDGLYAEAVEAWEQAIAFSSEQVFYRELAALHIKFGKDERAVRTLLFSLGDVKVAESEKFEIHNLLGNSYFRLRDLSKAESHYRHAYEINPRSDALHVNLGTLALEKNDLNSASLHFTLARNLNAFNSKAVSGLGMVEIERKNFNKAHELFLASLDLDPHNVNALFNLVKCCYELQKFNEFIEFVQKYYALYQNNSNICYSFAGILYHQGEYSRAAEEAGRILSANSNHTGAKELLELVQAQDKPVQPMEGLRK